MHIKGTSKVIDMQVMIRKRDKYELERRSNFNVQTGFKVIPAKRLNLRANVGTRRGIDGTRRGNLNYRGEYSHLLTD